MLGLTFHQKKNECKLIKQQCVKNCVGNVKPRNILVNLSIKVSTIIFLSEIDNGVHIFNIYA